jgi:hypothetical protein
MLNVIWPFSVRQEWRIICVPVRMPHRVRRLNGERPLTSDQAFKLQVTVDRLPLAVAIVYGLRGWSMVFWVLDFSCLMIDD